MSHPTTTPHEAAGTHDKPPLVALLSAGIFLLVLAAGIAIASWRGDAKVILVLSPQALGCLWVLGARWPRFALTQVPHKPGDA